MRPLNSRLFSLTVFVCFALFVAAIVAPSQTVGCEAEREGWQQLPEIYKAMDIGPGDIVADIGAGDGFLTLRLSPLVGEAGRVYAEDIVEARLERLRQRVAAARLENVAIIQGSEDDPHLPAGQLDSVIILNAYHEMPRHEEMLRRVREALKPGGRLVIAEPSPGPGQRTREQQTSRHRIASAFVAEEMAQAGFIDIEARERFAQIPTGGSYSLVVGHRAH